MFTIWQANSTCTIGDVRKGHMLRVDAVEVKKPKNARRNTDSRVKLMDGGKYPERSVWIQWLMRSVIKGC